MGRLRHRETPSSRLSRIEQSAAVIEQRCDTARMRNRHAFHRGIAEVLTSSTILSKTRAGTSSGEIRSSVH
jgi:hypothetical protein